jgi:HlyD family secretion protein
MDRAISEEERRRAVLRKLAVAAAAVLALGVLLTGFRALLRPSISASRIRTAVVERGPVEAAILCSGTVVPETEQVVPCPYAGRVRSVLVEPGTVLAQGQPIVELDDAEMRLRVERLKDEIALKENRRRELEQELEQGLEEIAGEAEIQQERVELARFKTEQQKALADSGLASQRELRQAEVDERIARIELRQLKERASSSRASTASRVKGLDIEVGLLKKDLLEAEDRLSRAMVRAGRAGVLTWVTPDEGAAIPEGQVVARVADLSRFRVEATAPDLHANRIRVGMVVRAVIGESALAGQVATVLPAMEDGIMTLVVDLEDPSSPLLKPNLRVDVHVITEARRESLRVRKGPFVSGTGEQPVFLLRDGSAHRVPVRIGVAGIDYFEVLSGLNEGDRIIVSSMSEYRHLESLRIRGFKEARP